MFSGAAKSDGAGADLVQTSIHALSSSHGPKDIINKVKVWQPRYHFLGSIMTYPKNMENARVNIFSGLMQGSSIVL
jgi:hypothetical protein